MLVFIVKCVDMDAEVGGGSIIICILYIMPCN